MEGDTPRTDACAWTVREPYLGEDGKIQVTGAIFTRELERELAAMRAERDAAIKERDALIAERDALRRENEAQTYSGNSAAYWHLKSKAYGSCIDSLWTVLSAAGYQPDGVTPIVDALTALIAERDALRKRVAELEAKKTSITEARLRALGDVRLADEQRIAVLEKEVARE